MAIDFDDRVAVITGSAGGIGLGLVRACLTRGMRVVLSDVDEERLRATVDALSADGATVVGQVADVREPDDLVALREHALAAFGRIDIVCNNAGIGFTKPLIESSADDWRIVIDINVHGVANGIRAFVPPLLDQGSGHVSATASLSGLIGDPELGVYNASKFAVVGMMEGLAHDLVNTGVSASVLCPGPVATDLLSTSAARTGVEAGDDVHAYLSQGMHPDEVGEMAVHGIGEGRFWLLPHQDLTEHLLRHRTDAMLDDGRLYVDPTDWTDQS